MKTSVVCIVLACACAKPNDLGRMQDEARIVESSAQATLDEGAKRIDAILNRSRTIPPNLPSINETGKLLGEANEHVIALRGMFGPCAAFPEQRDQKRWIQCQDKTTPYQKQVDDAIKAGDVDQLTKVVDQARAKLDEEWTVVNDRLTTVENWESTAEAGLKQ